MSVPPTFAAQAGSFRNDCNGLLGMRTNPSQVADAVVNDGSNAVITYRNWGGANQRWNFTP